MGQKRDRRLALGDLRLQAQVNDVTFGHHDLSPPLPVSLCRPYPGRWHGFRQCLCSARGTRR